MVQSVRGTTFAISASLPATHDVSGFGALTYLNAGEVTDIGPYGAVYDLIIHEPLATGIKNKFKGALDYGTSVTLTYAATAGDTGQAALKTSGDSNDGEISIRITHQDGEIDYCTCKVMQNQVLISTINNVKSGNASLEFTGTVVNDPA